ncbi:MAG: ribonuclease HIII [Candidatus Aminicenantes bacterium]|nr:ribonuclease HIII [Candidatus Aminicenantes bacterium]
MEQSDLFPPAAGHIGTDESGKGDYFGPLVIAGVFVPDGREDALRTIGVRDSKTIGDRRVKALAERVKADFPHSVVAVGPERYNELYAKLRNLNRILAWGHARVIENILERVDCRLAIADQFGEKGYILDALLRKGKRIELVQRVRAEEDAAVAAASVLARAEFLHKLRALSDEAGLDLPKGASPLVEEAGRRLAERSGPDSLGRFAKLHFKTTGRILGPGSAGAGA